MKSKSIKEAHVSFSAVIKFQVSVSGKAEKELIPFSIPVKIAGIVGGEIKVTPKIGISGTATLELSTTFSEGCTYKEGTFPKFFKKLTKPAGKQTFKAQAYVNAKIVLFAAFIGWDLFDVGFETSGTAEATNTKTGCVDLCVYWSFSAFVNSDKSLLGMLGVKMAWDIFDKDNTPFKKNMHIENGEVVDKCTMKSNNTKNSTTTNQGVDSGNWRQAYIDFLKKYMNKAEYPNDCGFSLVYIDNDDIPELVISKGTYHMAGASVYTYLGSKVIKLIDNCGTYGSVGYVEKKGIMYSEAVFMGGSSVKIYSVEAGTCKEIINLSDNVGNTPEGMEPEYRINDDIVSESEYNTAWDKFKDNDLSYSSDVYMELSSDAIESISNY